MKTYLVLLFLTTLASLWAVMRGSLIRAAIALAVASVMLSIIMFKLVSPLAAVFELSVCAGLITVIFMSTISVAQPLTYTETIEKAKGRIKRFWYLPVILIALGYLLVLLATNLNSPMQIGETEKNVYNVFWKIRQLDVFGQILILFVGVFGVVVLFKSKDKENND